MNLFETFEIKGNEIYVKNRKIGILAKNRTLILFRNEKHFFRLYNGWGINAELVRFLAENGYVDYVEIRTEKYIYKTHILNFLYYGIVYYFRDGNFVERQLILPEKHWQKIEYK